MRAFISLTQSGTNPVVVFTFNQVGYLNTIVILLSVIISDKGQWGNMCLRV